MPDPIAAKAAEQGVKSLGAVLDKLLGPTAEVMGEELVTWYSRKRNVRRVVDGAARRSDSDSLGVIPARVAAEVFDKAQWADNEFLAEYLSGVLASSRTPDGLDDSGVSWTALVGRLSSDQLALHWAIYSGFQRRVRGDSPDQIWEWTRRQIVLRFPDLFDNLRWPFSDPSDTNRLMDAAYGLRREGLLADLTHGGGDYLRDEVAWTRGKALEPNIGYLSFKVTSDGIGLLMHALGEGRSWFGDVVTQDISAAVDATDELPSGPTTVFVRDIPSIK